MGTAVSWAEARAQIVRALDRAPDGGRGVTKTPEPGDVLRCPVTAPTDVPHYASSAMDGFAVSGPGPWRLLAAPATGARGRNIHNTGGALDRGEALPVLTGSLMPRGATAVVRSEDATVTGTGTEALQLTADDPVDGRDIRPAGQEWSAGDVLVDAGVRLTPRHVAMLHVCGVDTVEAFARPRVACAFTGNEVITHGLPEPGEVRDAFGTSFPALLTDWGATVCCADRVPDDPVAVEDWLRRQDVLGADIVVVTGGSGRSGQDFARRFITRAADRVLADEVACQPGHPTLITVRRGLSGTQLVVGVPGNPLAAHVALHSFVAPAVTTLLGAGATAAATCRGTVSVSVDALRRRRVRLVPATRTTSPDSEGHSVLTPAPGTHSHMLRGYAVADALLVVPPEGLDAGSEVEFLPL
jgi:molybdopterin molybdotransferase